MFQTIRQSLSFQENPTFVITLLLTVVALVALIAFGKRRKALTTNTLVKASLLTALSIILTRLFSIMIPLAGLPALRFGFGEVPIIISGILFGPIAGGLTGAVADLLGVMLFPQGAFFPGFTLSAILRGAIPGLIYMVIRRSKTNINYGIINSALIIALAIGVGNLIFKSVRAGEINFADNPLYLVLMIVYVLIVIAFIVVPMIMTRNYNKINGDKRYSLDKITFTVTIPYIIISLGLNTLWLSIMFNNAFMVFLPGRILAGLIVIPMHSIIIFALSRFFKYANN